MGILPWKVHWEKTSVSVLGFCQTRIGELYFALEYHKKGDIDSLLVMRPTSKLKHEEIKRLTLLINDARACIDKTKLFICKANVFAKLKRIRFAEYHASNFSIIPRDDGFDFFFYVDTID